MSYYIGINGSQTGPFSEQEVRQRLARNEITGDTLVWTKGMSDWKPLSQVLAPIPAANTPASPAAPALPQLTPWTPAGLGQRFLAALIDNALVYGFFIAAAVAIHLSGSNLDDDTTTPSEFVIILSTFLILIAILIIQTWMLAKYAQTVGKKICKIRIYDLNTREQSTWVRCILLRAVANNVIGGFPCLGLLYMLVDTLFVFRPDRRCIHDLIAGTFVGRVTEK